MVMKILFLDIDGVINTVGGELGHRLCLGKPEEVPGKHGLQHLAEYFDTACLYHLYDIVTRTGCKIVISSTWRLGASLEEMKSWFKCKEIADAIIGKTPTFHEEDFPELLDRRGRVQRGEEIKDWLVRHPEVTHYAILDDDGDMDVVYENFFQVDGYQGLDYKTARLIIGHLNRSKEFKTYRINKALPKFLAELSYVYSGRPCLEENIQAITNLVRQLDNQEPD